MLGFQGAAFPVHVERGTDSVRCVALLFPVLWGPDYFSTAEKKKHTLVQDTEHCWYILSVFNSVTMHVKDFKRLHETTN